VSDRLSIPSPEEIADLQLPASTEDLIAEYDRRVGHRVEYLWKWLYEVFPRYRLSCVPERHHEAVRERKLLLTMFYTLLDDLADLHGDRATLMEARKLPFPHTTVDRDRPTVDDAYLDVATSVWRAVEDRMETAPRREEFRPIFRFDCRQFINSVHYGYLVSETPGLATERGAYAHGVHNMAQFSYADVDIMYSPGFDVADLRTLRSVVWPAQRLARIANWVATWQREVAENDPTSGVVVRSLEAGVLTVDELADPDVSTGELVDRIEDRDTEQQFLQEWDRCYDRLLERLQTCEAHSVDLRDYVTGMREMRTLYLDSRDRL